MPTILVTHRAMASTVTRSMWSLAVLMWMFASLMMLAITSMTWGVSKELERAAWRSFLAWSNCWAMLTAPVDCSLIESAATAALVDLDLASARRDLVLVKKFCKSQS